MSRITKTSLKCTVINQTTLTPAEVVAVILPFSDYSRTIEQVKTLPSAAIRYLSGAQGVDKVTLRKSSSLRAYTSGGVAGVRDYQQSASEAASTLALLPDTPILALYVGGASTEPTLRVFIEVFYDVVFFLPEWPSSVAYTDHTKIPRDFTNLTPLLDKRQGLMRNNPSLGANPQQQPLSEDDSSETGSVYDWDKYDPQSGEDEPPRLSLEEEPRPVSTTEDTESQCDPSRAPQADHPIPRNRSESRTLVVSRHLIETLAKVFREFPAQSNMKP